MNSVSCVPGSKKENIKYHQMAFQCYDIKDVPYSLPNCFPFFSKPTNIPQECSRRNFLNSDEIMYSYCIAGCTIESHSLSLTPLHLGSQFLSGSDAGLLGMSDIDLVSILLIGFSGSSISLRDIWQERCDFICQAFMGLKIILEAEISEIFDKDFY